MPFMKQGQPFLFDETTGASVGIKNPDGTETLWTGFNNSPLTSKAKVQRAVSAAPINGPQVSTIGTALQVTRGTQNGGPVSATVSMCTGTYANMQLAAQAKRVWSPAPDVMVQQYGPPPWVWQGYNPIENNYLGAPAIHVVHNGQYLELLMGNANPSFTIQVDGAYLFSKLINKGITSGAETAVDFSDGLQNTWVKFDFGSRATRRLGIWSTAGGGIVNLATADAKDQVTGWDRSDEPYCIAITDSYGQGGSTQWYQGGMYREAFARLGIPHVLFDAYGGTGFAPTVTQQAAGTAGRSRINENAWVTPDIVLIGLGLNDNANIADFQYTSANAALAGFTSAGNATLARARARYPSAILVVMGCPSPSAVNANFATQGAYNYTKNNVMLSAVRNLTGPWVWVDTFLDYVQTSTGYAKGPVGTYSVLTSSANPSGAVWMTGTGKTTLTTGDGNCDLYSDDGTHPNALGNVYMGTRLANALRPALMSL